VDISGDPITSRVLSFEAKINDRVYAGFLWVQEATFDSKDLLSISLRVNEGLGQSVYTGQVLPPEWSAALGYPALLMGIKPIQTYAILKDPGNSDAFAPWSFSRSDPPPQPSGPELISPPPRAALDNGRWDGRDALEWTFNWKSYPGASTYHLLVLRPNGGVSIIDDDGILGTEYRWVEDGGFVTDPERFGWSWRVRALVNGIWTLWSEVWYFEVEPIDTDPPHDAGTPGILYETDFDAFNTGTIHNQDGWEAMHTWSPVSWGNIVDLGQGNKVLAIAGGTEKEPWGEEVRRRYSQGSTLRFLTVEFDFALMSSNAFWFMDNYQPDTGPADSIFFWGSGTARSNADPPAQTFHAEYGTWHRIGIQIDQDARQIILIQFDGTWFAEDDSTGIAPWARLDRFIFRGFFFGAGPAFRPYPEIWIDELRISESEISSVDTDGDGIPNSVDNCDSAVNPDQKDADSDGKGDVCDFDDDADRDGIPNQKDNCRDVPNPDQKDTDGDGKGDACDFDDDLDQDGVPNVKDNCPKDYNPEQKNYDLDGLGDACDPDIDNDGVGNKTDEFLFSILSATVVIDDCDTTVKNHVFPNGYRFMDQIALVKGKARNHAEFVQGVVRLTNEWAAMGLIDNRERTLIQRCASSPQPVGPGQPGADPRRGIR